MKVIVFRAASDDSVVVRHPSPTRLAELISGGMTETEALTSLANSHAPNITGEYTFQIIEDTELHTDRYFRNAWEWED